MRNRKSTSFIGRGYGRFLSFPDNGDVTINEARIKDAVKWDGLHSMLFHGADDLGLRMLLPDITNSRKSKPVTAPISMVSRSGRSVTGHALACLGTRLPSRYRRNGPAKQVGPKSEANHRLRPYPNIPPKAQCSALWRSCINDISKLHEKISEVKNNSVWRV